MSDPYKTPEADLSVDSGNNGMELASRGLRFAGALLDSLITGLPVVGLAYYLGYYESMDSSGNLSFDAQIILFLVGIGLFLLVNGYLIYNRGQTIGKVICGTRVVTLDGQQVSGNTYLFVRLLPIWLVTQIPFIGSVISLVDSLLIFRKDHNCLHDDIAKTRVVRA